MQDVQYFELTTVAYHLPLCQPPLSTPHQNLPNILPHVGDEVDFKRFIYEVHFLYTEAAPITEHSLIDTF